MGAFYTTQGLGGLVGPIVAGAAIDAFDSYRPVIIACIALELLALALLRGLPDGSD